MMWKNIGCSCSAVVFYLLPSLHALNSPLFYSPFKTELQLHKKWWIYPHTVQNKVVKNQIEWANQTYQRCIIEFHLKKISVHLLLLNFERKKQFKYLLALNWTVIFYSESVKNLHLFTSGLSFKIRQPCEPSCSVAPHAPRSFTETGAITETPLLHDLCPRLLHPHPFYIRVHQGWWIPAAVLHRLSPAAVDKRSEECQDGVTETLTQLENNLTCWAVTAV